MTCSRHGLWRANGIGDLQKGERYVYGFFRTISSGSLMFDRQCNVDYVFLSSVKGIKVLYIVISYDVICQWGVHFWTRMRKMKAELHLTVPEANVVMLIPKFHLPAHKLACQSYYSFNLAKGVGQTHGETIEENWADSNKAAAQTKEMGPGSRQDTLDDIYGFHNWSMLLGLQRVLKTRLVIGVKAFELHRGLFEKFHSALLENLGTEVLDGWEREVTAWEKDHSQPCPYESTVSGQRTLKEVQLELGQEELEELSRGGGVVQDSSVCVFVVTGLEIEESQCVTCPVVCCRF